MSFKATYTWKKDVGKFKIHFVAGRPLDGFSSNKYATAQISLFGPDLVAIGDLYFVSDYTDIYHAGDEAYTISSDAITLWYPHSAFDSMALLLANADVSSYVYTIGTSPGLSAGVAFVRAGLGGGTV